MKTLMSETFIFLKFDHKRATGPYAQRNTLEGKKIRKKKERDRVGYR